MLSDCRTIEESFFPTRVEGWPLTRLPAAYLWARALGDICMFAGPTTVQIKTRLPSGAACCPRMIPAYFPSPPLPAGLKPQLIFRSNPSAPPNVQVSTPHVSARFLRQGRSSKAQDDQSSQRAVSHATSCSRRVGANAPSTEKLPRFEHTSSRCRRSRCSRRLFSSAG